MVVGVVPSTINIKIVIFDFGWRCSVLLFNLSCNVACCKDDHFEAFGARDSRQEDDNIPLICRGVKVLVVDVCSPFVVRPLL